MTDIRFYHLIRKTAEQALPDLLLRALAKQHKIVIRCNDNGQIERLNEDLWTYSAESFLPHGTAQDNFPESQPIFLTSGQDNPAKADVLMIMPGANSTGVEAYTLCCYLLNGQDITQVDDARKLWKIWKDAGHMITYWQQDEQGKWGQKA